MINTRQKRGVSPLVGYVLLVVFAIVISAGVYTWLKTYVPAETLNCKDGVSFFVKEADFNNSLSQQLNLTIRNNGRFTLAGYFIHATNDSSQNLATIDLSQYLNATYGGVVFGNSVLFSVTGGNTLKPGEEATHIFEVPAGFGELYSLDVVPTIFQTENGKERFVSCSNEQVKQIIGEAGGGSGAGTGATCGNSVIETGETCDDGNTVSNDGCSSTCQIETATTCNNNNVKETGETCDGTDFGNVTGCYDLGYDTGNLSCNNQCNFDTSQCTSCPSGEISDGNGGCTTVGNGVCDAGETCSQEPTACEGLQASCVLGQTCQTGTCTWQGGVYGEDEYCIDLGYTSGNCVANSGQCVSQSGTDESDQPGGSIYCPGQVLCCFG